MDDRGLEAVFDDVYARLHVVVCGFGTGLIGGGLVGGIAWAILLRALTLEAILVKESLRRAMPADGFSELEGCLLGQAVVDKKRVLDALVEELRLAGVGI